jgi:hypothetical protein
MATINHKTYNEGTETFKDFSVYDGKDTLIFKVDGSAQSAAVTGTLAVSGNATFDTTTLVVDATNNRVGVGTATPASTLDVSGTLAVSGASTSAGLILSTDDAILATDGSVSRHSTVGLTLKAVAGIVFNFSVYSEDDNALIVNPTGTNNIGFVSGNVGIGTSAPASTLDVSGTLAVSSNATFNTTTLVVDATNNRLAMGGATVAGYRLNVYGLQRMIGTDTVLNFGELDSNANYFQSLNIAGDTGKDTVFFSTAERMRITAAGVLDLNQGQIKFPATQVPSADANTLDDYEQGTFTATLKGSVSDPSTAVTTTGRYTKIGDVVSLRIAFASVDTTGASGDATIIGLPFTSSGISVGGATSNLFGFAGRTSISSYVNNSTTLSVFATSDGGSFTDIQHSAGAGRWLVCAITYFV